jgi:hypothetical protein
VWVTRPKNRQHGEQIHHRIFVGAERKFSVLKILEFFDRPVRALPQVQHLLGEIK